MSSPAKSSPLPKGRRQELTKPALLGLLFVCVTGLLAAAVLLSIPPRSDSPTRFVDPAARPLDVRTGKVGTPIIDGSGRVSGELTEGACCPARVPSTVHNQDLAADLAPHQTTVNGMRPGSSVWSVVTALLPFVVLLGVYFWINRPAPRPFTRAVLALGRSRAKGSDEQRSSTEPMALSAAVVRVPA